MKARKGQEIQNPECFSHKSCQQMVLRQENHLLTLSASPTACPITLHSQRCSLCTTLRRHCKRQYSLRAIRKNGCQWKTVHFSQDSVLRLKIALWDQKKRESSDGSPDPKHMSFGYSEMDLQYHKNKNKKSQTNKNRLNFT